MKYGNVVFKNEYGFSKTYEYQTTLKNLKVGELVIVEARDWYQIARFEGYKAKSTMANLKYIVAVLDTDRVEQEKEIAKQQQNLKAAIELRVMEIEEEKRLKELAESDSTLKELIDKLNSLE